MTKRTATTAREWALFGVRWIIPVGLLLGTLNGLPGPEDVGPILLVVILSAISNVIVTLLLLLNVWASPVTGVVVVVDALLACAAVVVGGPGMFWAGVLPAMVAGFYYDWLPGLLVGAAIAIVMAAIEIILPSPGGINIAFLLLTLLALPGVGPAAAFLKHDENQIVEIRERGQRAQRLGRIAAEYMTVIYEMTSVLSTSRLDPRRVLVSAVEFGVDGLERVGVRGPLYGAAMLFTPSDDPHRAENDLKVHYATNSVLAMDEHAVVPGHAGAIGMAMINKLPEISLSPAEDAELVLMETYRKCRTVMVLPLLSGDESYGVILMGSGEVNAFKEPHLDLMRTLANQSAAALQNARLYDALLTQRDRILSLEKAARAQLASELHDGPTQGVAAITMRLNYIRRLIEKKPDVAGNELYQVEDLARRTAKEMRQMLFELRPKALDQGLRAGLEQLAVKTEETYVQKVVVEVEDNCDQSLDSQTTLTLFSVATEAITNARKHASAELIRVRAFVRENTLVFEVSDNGNGFDVEKALADARKREGHLGLVNLIERAAVLEGTLHLDSAPGQGTRIAIYIPMAVIDYRRNEEQRRAAQGGEQEVVVVTGTNPLPR